MAIKVVSVSLYDGHCSRQREQLPNQTVCRLEADIFRHSSWYRRRHFTGWLSLGADGQQVYVRLLQMGFSELG